MGVLGDFSGNPTEPLKPLKDRKFIQIDRDNFNDVMARMTPGLNFRVENTLKGDGSEMAVQAEVQLDGRLRARPASSSRSSRSKKLLETRDKLRDLLTKVDRSDELEGLLEQILQEHRGPQEAVGRTRRRAAGGASGEEDDP